MRKSEQGLGTVRTVRDRNTNKIVGYRALLPREHSKAPTGIRNPSRYQEPIGNLCATKDEARRLLDAVLVELVEKRAVRHGLPFAHYATAVLKARLQDARRQYGNDARANRHIATWRSIERLWLRDASWFEWPPESIEHADLQRYFDQLTDEAEGASGEPLSGSFVRQVASYTKAIFEKANVHPNPTLELKLPKKGTPKVAYLELGAQRRLFGADASALPLVDRVMIGCGMGAGLRVGELLSMERDDVHVDDQDPHLFVKFGGAHHAPPKGRRHRRVELFEPGLGFWRLWLARYYSAGSDLVFAGPLGGYAKAWPEQFPGWAELAGVGHLSSHIMRHTYAVAMLSGSWGYDPKSLEFVAQQLGHREVSTTERYYGAFAPGVWQREVRQMTGRSARARTPVTAATLLGDDASDDASPIRLLGKSRQKSESPSLTQNSKSSEKTAQSDAPAHQASWELAEAVLRAAEAADPTVVAKAIDLARRVLADESRAASRQLPEASR